VEWLAQAACRDANPELFFQEKGFSQAKEICDRCPVVSDCQAWAVQHLPWYGIAGGMTAAERRAVRRKQVEAELRAQGRITRQGRKIPLAPELVQTVIDLTRQGYSAAKIEESTGVGRETVRKLVKREAQTGAL
jgi:WhiB family redox-sensing transcriptional regulator